MKIFATMQHPDKQPESLVFLLHGWGANGQDLLPIAEIWQEYMPETLFICPQAPDICDQNPLGYQWFSLGDWSEEAMLRGIKEAAPHLDVFLSQQMKQYQVPPEKTILMGFSQGMMMALYTGLRQKEVLGGILGYSGRLLGEADIPVDSPKPPLCLIHGEADPVVPFVAHRHAVNWLIQHDYQVQSLSIPGLPHGIDDSGLETGSEFVRQQLM